MPVQHATEFLDHDGMMADAIRDFDWRATPLGPVERWPGLLKSTIGTILESKFPMCVVWGPDLIAIYNEAFRAILGGKRDALGRSFRDVWGEAWHFIGPLVEKAYEGEATFIEDYPLSVERYGFAEDAFFTFSCSPIRDETGSVVGMLDTVVETTEKVRSQRNARRINSELAHRVRNLFALISAITDQTFRLSPTKEEAKSAISLRLKALAQAQEILSHTSWSGATMQAVVEGALAPHRTSADQMSVDGPDLHLSPHQTLSLALALNELATNAIKYGALSDARGQVAVTWSVEGAGEDAIFRFVWQERGGPPVTQPTRRGFGLRLIERSLAADFRGAVQMIYGSAGLRCELMTTLEDLYFAAQRAKPKN